jgi:hypothetical protein
VGAQSQLPENLPDLRVKTRYHLSLSVLINIGYSYVLIFLVFAKLHDFAVPQVTANIAIATSFCYIFGSLVLKNTPHRRSFYSTVITYSFIYYFYARVYYLSSFILINWSYMLQIVQAIFHSINKFSFQFERIQFTMESGFTEIIAENMIRYMRREFEQELLLGLNTEILVTQRRKRWEAHRDTRSRLGLSVEEPDLNGMESS